jgi:hypothetical protein
MIESMPFIFKIPGLTTPACSSVIESVQLAPSRFLRPVRVRAARFVACQIRVDRQVKVGTQLRGTIRKTYQGIECSQRDYFSLILPLCWTRSIPQPASTVTSVRIVPELGIQPSIDRSIRQAQLLTRTLEVSCDLAYLYSNERKQ